MADFHLLDTCSSNQSFVVDDKGADKTKRKNNKKKSHHNFKSKRVKKGRSYKGQDDGKISKNWKQL